MLSLVIGFRTAAQAHTAFNSQRGTLASGEPMHGVAGWPVGALGQERVALIGTRKDAHGVPLADALVFFRQGVYVVMVAIFNVTPSYPGEHAARLAAIVDARIRSTLRS